jgi:ferrochelatase
MRIDTILNIIDGELVNAGFISEIAGFADSLKEMKREYLFVSDNIDNIKEAIAKGAYAILSTEYHEIIDNEIAWIRVDDIKEALFKLLKYKLLNKTLYVCNKITLDILKSISKSSEIAIIDKVKAKFLNEYEYYITSNEELANISINTIPLTKKEKIELIDSTLFISKFRYKGVEYNAIFPALYLDELSLALGFLEENELEYNLKSLKISRFTPQFVNIKNEKIPFGKSDRVVIKGIENDEFLTRDLNFIFAKVRYALVKFYDINNIDFFYKDNYNFAILIGVDVELKEKEDIQEKLF